MESPRSSRRRPSIRAAATAIVAAAVTATSAVATTPATATTTVRATENASLRLVKKTGMLFTHRGTVTGTVSGPARSTIRLKGLSISGTVTVVSRHGELRIRISGKARSGGSKPRFEGTARMSGGTGRYRKATGNGRFNGVIDRSNWATTIRAVGSLTV